MLTDFLANSGEAGRNRSIVPELEELPVTRVKTTIETELDATTGYGKVNVSLPGVVEENEDPLKRVN